MLWSLPLSGEVELAAVPIEYLLAIQRNSQILYGCSDHCGSRSLADVNRRGKGDLDAHLQEVEASAALASHMLR